jgi:hypothetical protein
MLTPNSYTPVMRYRTWRLWSASGDHKGLRHSSISNFKHAWGVSNQVHALAILLNLTNNRI